MLNLPDDFRDLIQILSRNGVQYMIVGGYALSLYAAPRTTGDIDIFVKIDPENAKRILHSLDEFGFGDLDISEQDLLSPAQVIQLGFPPNRVDFMTTIEGVSWEEAFANRKQVIQDGLTFPVIGKEELVKNKLSTGRLKDMADVEQVRKKDKQNPQNSSRG